MAILDRVTLSPRHALLLVEVEGQKLLVATAPGGATSFQPILPAGQQLDPSLPSSASSTVSDGFAERLAAEAALQPQAARIGRVAW